MGNIVDVDHYRTKRAARGTSGSDGGDVDEVLRRLGVIESLLVRTREDVSAMKAAFAHLATKAEMNDLKAGVSAIKGAMPLLATKADVIAVKADLHAFETRMLRWMVGTSIAVASVAFTIAMVVN